MAKALERILRIRQLAEEQARLEVERAAQRARQVAAACTRQAKFEHEQRASLAESWIARPQADAAKMGCNGTADHSGETGEEKAWLMEEALLEFFGWRRMRLEKLREAEIGRMEPLIALYTERRRELRQTEQLVEQRVNTETMERRRRAQAETDEWFSQQSRRKELQELRRAQTPSPQNSKDDSRETADESANRRF